MTPAHSAAFSLAEEAAKKKLQKENGVSVGLCPTPYQTFFQKGLDPKTLKQKKFLIKYFLPPRGKKFRNSSLKKNRFPSLKKRFGSIIF
jgi:hypothetical protein